jgi:Rps23 Pro-64 3,4-dihydroxylase Tpa1-like proline 4-hydroxylase
VLNTEAFSERESAAVPFPYFVVGQAFDESSSLRLLEWLEREAPWQLTEADFYEQYEFSLADIELPGELAPLFSSEAIDAVKNWVEGTFGAKLKDQPDITVHKLVAGQRIRIHNDYIPDQESHRVLVQLNRGWTDDMGGALIFFNSHDPTDMHRAFRPNHNSCVGFEISPKSLHAVSTIHSGERFTLVFSFYRATP